MKKVSLFFLFVTGRNLFPVTLNKRVLCLYTVFMVVNCCANLFDKTLYREADLQLVVLYAIHFKVLWSCSCCAVVVDGCHVLRSKTHIGTRCYFQIQIWRTFDTSLRDGALVNILIIFSPVVGSQLIFLLYCSNSAVALADSANIQYTLTHQRNPERHHLPEAKREVETSR